MTAGAGGRSVRQKIRDDEATILRALARMRAPNCAAQYISAVTAFRLAHPRNAAVWPSQATLAAFAGVSLRTIQNGQYLCAGVGLATVHASAPYVHPDHGWISPTHRHVLHVGRAWEILKAGVGALVKAGVRRVFPARKDTQGLVPKPPKALTAAVLTTAAAVPVDVALPPPLPLMAPTRPPHARCCCEYCQACLDSLCAGWEP